MAYIRGAWSLIAGLSVTLREFFKPVVTSSTPASCLDISPGFAAIRKLIAEKGSPEKVACTACLICVKSCPSASIQKVEGEKREGEKRKTATTYILNFTTCSQCGICVEVCPFDALAFSADFNIVGYKREDCYFDLVKEFERGRTQDERAEIIFLIIALTTMGGAVMAILSGSIIYAMIGLVTTMFGIAGLYVYLNSPFLAMMQILIYVALLPS